MMQLQCFSHDARAGRPAYFSNMEPIAMPGEKRGALRLVKDANKQVQVTCKKPVKSKQTLQIRPAAQSSSYGRSSAACAGCFNKF